MNAPKGAATKDVSGGGDRYTTVYCKQVKRRKTGFVETVGCAYTTKSETAMHAEIRAKYPDAQTWLNPSCVITDFVPGFNLGMRPMVFGGRLIAGAES